jgi:hypothetical protein
MFDQIHENESACRRMKRSGQNTDVNDSALKRYLQSPEN